MYFASDNAGPAHPTVMDAMVAANTGYQMGYGADTLMDGVRAQIREAFEAPDAIIILATMAKPWETIFCSPMAHIHEDECNAPEFYSGAKLTLVPAENAKMTPDALRRSMAGEETRGVHGPQRGPVHGPQRGPVSITQVTEKGTVHTLDEIKALTSVAKEFGVTTHLDGARFANAMVALGCSAADMTWKAGIDAVSFGGTKNGLMGVEACVIFDPDLAREFELRRKRGGHLFSKHRYLSAQMQAYMTDDLWITMATAANAACARLTAGMRGIDGITLAYEPDANIIFFRATRARHADVQSRNARRCL